MRGRSAFQNFGVLQFALPPRDRRAVRPACCPTESRRAGRPANWSTEPDCRFGGSVRNRKVRRHQRAAKRKEDRRLKRFALFLRGVEKFHVGRDFALAHRPPEGSRQKRFEDLRARLDRPKRRGRVWRSESWPADLYSLAAKSTANFASVHILFGMQRRKEQRLGSVIETFAARAINGKRLAYIHVNFEQVLNGGRSTRRGSDAGSVRARGRCHPRRPRTAEPLRPTGKTAREGREPETVHREGASLRSSPVNRSGSTVALPNAGWRATEPCPERNRRPETCLRGTRGNKSSERLGRCRS